MANDDLGQLTAEEVGKFRELLKHVKFEEPAGDGGDPDGGDVTLQPGTGVEGGLPGMIVMDNPGGTARPFLTIRDGDSELDVYLGPEGPRSTDGRDARVGSVYLEYGGGPNGARPLKVHRRTVEGWVWAKWS